VRGGLHKRAGNSQFTERQTERYVTAILRRERKRHPSLRQGADKASQQKSDAQSGSAGGKKERAFH
jgi:hypothetical protein